MAASELIDWWPAPAKLNLFLRITGRRTDGYHSLQTVFQFLDYCDYLSFDVRDDGTIVRQGNIPAITPDNDLIVRAARLLQQTTQTQLGANIVIRKILPIGGGLGGGSSDAATTLIALNIYWQTGLLIDELASLGLKLGADVPVFVHGFAAWAEGIGEKLIPVTPAEPWFIVIIPPCQVHTARIFSDSELTRDSEPIKMRASISEIEGNDCERVVFRNHPEVAAAATWLSHFGKAHLTGTGACVFAAFADQTVAEQVLAQKPANMRGFIARGCNRSPLHELLQRATIIN
jgi:4-diphosphocytidyl-2-C-methyl-D-erythritol kinase